MSHPDYINDSIEIDPDATYERHQLDAERYIDVWSDGTKVLSAGSFSWSEIAAVGPGWKIVGQKPSRTRIGDASAHADATGCVSGNLIRMSGDAPLIIGCTFRQDAVDDDDQWIHQVMLGGSSVMHDLTTGIVTHEVYREHG